MEETHDDLSGRTESPEWHAALASAVCVVRGYAQTCWAGAGGRSNCREHIWKAIYTRPAVAISQCTRGEPYAEGLPWRSLCRRNGTQICCECRLNRIPAAPCVPGLFPHSAMTKEIHHFWKTLLRRICIRRCWHTPPDER